MTLRINAGDGRPVIIEPSPYLYSENLQFNSADASVSCALLGDTTIEVPSNPVGGSTLEVFLTATGLDCNVSFNNLITLSQMGGNYNGPFLIESGTTLSFTLQYDGSRGKWVVPSLMAQY